MVIIRAVRTVPGLPFTGTLEEICRDLLYAEQLGITQVILEPGLFVSDLQGQIDWLHELLRVLARVKV